MIVFDIETNGLYDTVSRVHCINCIDTETGREMRFTDHVYYQSPLGDITNIEVPRSGTIAEALELLTDADEIAGHNIVGYDIPVLQKLHPSFKPTGRIFDTMVAAKMLYLNISDKDRAAKAKGKLPEDFRVGSHSLANWGIRLGGEQKDDFKPSDFIGRDGRPHSWETIPFVKAMDDYCMQDVRTNVEIALRFKAKDYSEEAMQLEMDVQRIISWQERNGVPFSVGAAEKLTAQLYTRLYELQQGCQSVFPPFFLKDGSLTPKRDNKARGYTAGASFSKLKLVEFNPSSRSHIAHCLKRKYKWQPTVFTDTGLPKIDEEILAALPFAEARQISEYMMVQKRLSQIAEGSNAWLKRVKSDGYIYGRVNTLGTGTRRMTHNSPNLAQVPNNGSPFGLECRALFTAESGRVLVGCDADALELRILAHFLARFDGGAYVETVLNGSKEDGTDMHSRNRDAVGLIKRDTAKTWFYAFIYGAGNYKLGTVVMSEWSEDKLVRFNTKFSDPEVRKKKISAIGAKSRAKLMKSLPAFKQFSDAVQGAARRGYIKAIDGGHVPVRALHSALNFVCQSAGAVIMKKALVIMFDEYESRGLDVLPLLNIHDEVQLSALKEEADEVGKIAAEAITRAGEHFNFRCPLAGDYDIGQNWSETH